MRKDEVEVGAARAGRRRVAIGAALTLIVVAVPSGDPIASVAKMARLASLPYARGYRAATPGSIIRVQDQSFASEGPSTKTINTVAVVDPDAEKTRTE